MMGVGVVFGTAVVVSIFPTNAGLAGLALTSALNLTGEHILQQSPASQQFLRSLILLFLD